MSNITKMKLQYLGHMVRGCAGELSLSVLEGAQCRQKIPKRPAIELDQQHAGVKW